MKDPKVKIWLMYAVSFAGIGLALFLSAGTVNYWQLWAYLGVGLGTSTLLTLYIIKDPVLLARRVKAGPAAEQRPRQKIIVRLMGFPVLASLLVPGLDRRFGWSDMPPWLSIAGDLLILASMWMVFRVFRENSFGSSTIGIVRGQKVVTTGPYAVVRNPMYAGAVVYFFGLALALGSYWDLLPALLMVFGFAGRLLDEEKFLSRSLPGYKKYCKKVRFRLVPYLW